MARGFVTRIIGRIIGRTLFYFKGCYDMIKNYPIFIVLLGFAALLFAKHICPKLFGVCSA